MNLLKKERINGFVVRTIMIFIAAGLFAIFAKEIATGAALQANQSSLVIKEGDTWQVTANTHLNDLIIGEGAVVRAPDGYDLTMTVDGIETGQKLVTTSGVNTQIVPGTYHGNILLTLTEKNAVSYQGLTYPLRQALFLDESGIVEAKSVRQR